MLQASPVTSPTAPSTWTVPGSKRHGKLQHNCRRWSNFCYHIFLRCPCWYNVGTSKKSQDTNWGEGSGCHVMLTSQAIRWWRCFKPIGQRSLQSRKSQWRRMTYSSSCGSSLLRRSPFSLDVKKHDDIGSVGSKPHMFCYVLPNRFAKIRQEDETGYWAWGCVVYYVPAFTEYRALKLGRWARFPFCFHDPLLTLCFFFMFDLVSEFHEFSQSQAMCHANIWLEAPRQLNERHIWSPVLWFAAKKKTVVCIGKHWWLVFTIVCFDGPWPFLCLDLPKGITSVPIVSMPRLLKFTIILATYIFALQNNIYLLFLKYIWK